MFTKINNLFQINKNFLNLMAYRQKIISSNIANAETPNYRPLNINFKNEINNILHNKINKKKQIFLKKTSSNHLSLHHMNKFNIVPDYPIKTFFNKNVIDMNQERISFIENSLKYQSQISFLTYEIKNIMNTILGQ
ncbi:flagellar basal body rod protein FlgB [Buchnera aphidicola]|uniref:flagellar basal body rod protein FlgB n=1 Tax=Buchnera aphidicola TaxID=9 RepID=UPI003464AF9D